jgi:hypothetical protein
MYSYQGPYQKFDGNGREVAIDFSHRDIQFFTRAEIQVHFIFTRNN